ncbi:acyltransferase family protein [Clostridium sardiniense]
MTRNAYYDNAKFIFIFLVVLGHLLEPSINESNITKSIFIFIYIFHMPCFIFTNGYFTKIKSWKETFKECFKFLIMYIVIQALFIAFTKIINVNSYKWTLFTPYYIYWYIFAIVLWKFIFRLFYKINLKLLFIFSLIIGLAVGLIDTIGTQLSLSRVFVFFPFFILGYYCRINGLNIRNAIKNKFIAINMLLISFIIVASNINVIKYSWLYCYSSYSNLKVSQFNGIIDRSFLYLIQFILLLAVFSLIPAQKERFTTWGTNTLSIYLVHGFIIKFILKLGFYDTFNIEKFLLIPLIAIVSIFAIMISKRILTNTKKLLLE